MRRRPVLVALLAAAVTLTACGGGLSASEYRAKAKQICVDAKQAIESVKQPTRATPEAIADYFQRVLAANDRTAERFRRLDPPDDLQKAHEAALAANDAARKEVRRVIDELEQGSDPRAVLSGATDRLRELTRRFGDAGDRLGVPECAQE